MSEFYVALFNSLDNVQILNRKNKLLLDVSVTGEISSEAAKRQKEEISIRTTTPSL